MDHSFAVFRLSFIVPGVPPAAADPREGAFDYPPLWQDDESLDEDTVRLWNAETGKEIETFRGHSLVVSRVAFSPDRKRLEVMDSERSVSKLLRKLEHKGQEAAWNV